jgi:hypothetical protein
MDTTHRQPPDSLFEFIRKLKGGVVRFKALLDVIAPCRCAHITPILLRLVLFSG